MILTKKLYMCLCVALGLGTHYTVAMFKNSTTKKPLCLAVQDGDKETIEFLLTQKNSDINQQDVNGETPLHLAIEKMNLKIIKSLLLHGANRYITDNKGHTAIDLVIERKHPDLTTYFEIIDALFLLYKNLMSFENFAKSFLELNNTETVRKNWKYSVQLTKRIGCKKIKQDLYNWGIKKYEEEFKEPENPRVEEDVEG